MTGKHAEHRFTRSGQNLPVAHAPESPLRRAATAPTPMQGQDGVWLPVIVVPSTFIFCVLMFFILRVG